MGVRALVELRPDLTPMVITHARLAMTWRVLRTLEYWTQPRDQEAEGAAEITRYRCWVRGPLPGRPAQIGEFTMVVRMFGDKPGQWWVNPE